MENREEQKQVGRFIEKLHYMEKSMIEEEHVKAVREFLHKKFPVSTIEDCFDTRIEAHSFLISGTLKEYRTAIKQEFFNSVEPSQIASRLSDFLLAEHLIELPDTLVVVTGSGLTLEYET